jgi:protocatechuate 3,4-dioxygenase beta subunit
MRAPIVALALVALLVPGGSLAQRSCAPTRPDMLGPFYKPDAPERVGTGRGLVVTGSVRSTRECAPLPASRLEWWSADGHGEYRDELRATERADADGRYRYETERPGRYPGRPPHLHVKVTAPHHRTLVTQLYPKSTDTELSVDFVLVPE